jgi:hypothetical protein
MAYRTLGELQSELLARLGMGAMGASGGANATLTASFLRNAQVQLYRMQDWRHLIDYEDKTLGTSQNLLDYPDTGTLGAGGCARDKRVLKVERVLSGQYVQLEEGIDTGMWDTMDTLSWPARFDRLAQIMIYPKADTTYTVRIWYVADLARFTQANDEASLDDEMILLHALANAKAHYRQPDAATYQGQLNTLLASLRGQSFSRKGVYRRDETPPSEPKPQTVV